MNLSDFTVVRTADAILHQQISNHPNFNLQPIIREVVIDELDISAKNNFRRGFHIDYYINHYNDGKIEPSFLKQTMKWSITDNQMVAERDFTGGTFQPIDNPDYLLAIEANKLPATIPNPEYVSDEELLKIPETIPNPNYVSEEETPGIPATISNPAYYEAVEANKLPTKIDNPAHVSNDELSMMDKYKMAPAFSYLLPVVKAHPELIIAVLSFYITEQDADGFFDNYNKQS